MALSIQDALTLVQSLVPLRTSFLEGWVAQDLCHQKECSYMFVQAEERAKNIQPRKLVPQKRSLIQSGNGLSVLV